MDFSARVTTKDATRTWRRRSCTPPRFSSTPPTWFSIYCSDAIELIVEITDQIVTDRVINELMGKDASARFRFIMERADEAEELDV